MNRNNPRQPNSTITLPRRGRQPEFSLIAPKVQATATPTSRTAIATPDRDSDSAMTTATQAKVQPTQRSTAETNHENVRTSRGGAGATAASRESPDGDALD